MYKGEDEYEALLVNWYGRENMVAVNNVRLVATMCMYKSQRVYFHIIIVNVIRELLQCSSQLCNAQRWYFGYGAIDNW